MCENNINKWLGVLILQKFTHLNSSIDQHHIVFPGNTRLKDHLNKNIGTDAVYYSKIVRQLIPVIDVRVRCTILLKKCKTGRNKIDFEVPLDGRKSNYLISIEKKNFKREKYSNPSNSRGHEKQQFNPQFHFKLNY